jgi:FG-GAP-like repeat
VLEGEIFMNSSYLWFVKIAFFCGLMSVAASHAPAQTYAFGTASYTAPGLGSVSPPQGNAPLITADFNSDGIPDVAILGTTSAGEALSIFLGRPDGSFAPRVDYTVQASGFTVGDFSGDGKVDVIIIGTAGVSIFWGNGDGTLQVPVPLNLTIGGGYSAATSGDFNGDSKEDLLLLTPNFGSGSTMAILLGNGDGTFQTPVTYAVPQAPYHVLGDFNGDGRPDIAIAGGLSGSGEVSILINNGDGTFKSPVIYSVSGNVQALAAADLNGDGKLDLVVPSGGTSATISVLLGNGDGTWKSHCVYE